MDKATIAKLEAELVRWHQKLSFHLPAGFQKWLAENVWWIVIIGVIGSLIGIINFFRVVALRQDVVNYANQIGVSLAPSTTLSMAGVWVSIITLIIVVILQLRAISPLQHRKKIGWNLLFYAAAVSLLGTLVSGFITGNIITALVTVILSGAIAWFFLFEIRRFFVTTSKTIDKPTHTK